MFDLISSDFSERILGDAYQIVVFLMIIVISVLFNLLAVTILLMKYSKQIIETIRRIYLVASTEAPGRGSLDFRQKRRT